MHNFNSKWVLFFLLILTNLTLSQSNVKTWTESTTQDFSNNQLNNLIVKNDSVCEVQLQDPLVKTIKDYNDNSFYRFRAKDNAGNFVNSMVTEDGDVFIQKYSSNGNAISKSIRVNEQKGSAEYEGLKSCRASVLDNGTFIVIWINKINSSTMTEGAIYGQIFINDSVKQGNNFELIDNIPFNYFLPYIIANNKENNFILFYVLKPADQYKIYAEIRNAHGNKIGDANLLNQKSLTPNEFVSSVISDEKGYWVSWYDNVGSNPSLYMRHFSFDGIPLNNIIKAKDNISLGLSSGLTLCRDNYSHLFIAYQDLGLNGEFNIYGQLYDSLGAAIGTTIQLNSIHINDNNQAPDVEFVNNQFQVSWWCNNSYYVNGFKYDPKLSGNMVSSIFDASPEGCTFNEISWDYITYSHSDLKFQIRSANTIDQLNNSSWYGPTSSMDFYTVNSGQKINTIHNGNRYIQYKAFFTSEYGNSPELKSVNIKFIPSDSIFPNPPLNLTATNNHVHVFLNWQPNTDKDVAVYKIYRSVISNNYNESWYKIVPKNFTSYIDSSALIGKKYYYVVTAIDSSHNESVYSNEVQMMFSGMNIYVSSSAGSNGSGSFNSPVKTIQQGINLASQGDTIRILPGVYNESILAIPRLSFIGAGADKCSVSSLTAYDDCVIKGLTFTNSLYCQKGSQLITENIIRGAENGLILNEYPCSPIITKNFITATVNGIFANSTCGTAIIRNNIIKVQDLGIDINGSGSPIITNNVISVSPAPSSWVSLTGNNAVFENNILLNGIGIGSADSYNTYSNYNDVWKAQFPISGNAGANIGVDPQFVNEAIQDYRLLPGSLCKNAGDPNPIYNNVDGTRNDIGAYGGPDPFDMVITSQLSRSISVSSLSGYPGDTISVYISLDNNAGLGKADIIFDYDNTLLGFLNALLSEATANFSIDHQNLSSNEIKFSISANSSTIGMSKNILILKFVVNPNSKTNDASPLVLKTVNLYDTKLNKILLSSLTNGAFVVNNTTESKNYIYVDSKYTGASDGHRQRPFNTIMKAVNAAISKDTIIVAGGNYHEQIIMKEGVSIFGSGSSVTNIISDVNQNGVLFNNIKNSEISGFTFLSEGLHDMYISIINCQSSSPKIDKNVFAAEIYQSIAIQCTNNSNADIENNCLKQMDLLVDASNPIIKNNYIDCFVEGVRCTGNSNPLITGNKITGEPGAPDISIIHSTATIKNNYLYCASAGYGDGQGILLDNADNSKVFNNIFKGQLNLFTGIKINNSQNVAVINNTFVTKGNGIEEVSSTANIINNIVVNNSVYGIDFSGSTTMDYNAFWNNSVNYNGTNPGGHNINGNIMFADTSKDNFRLLKNSPCINAGNPDPVYNDADKTRNDIGAYGGPYADSSWTNLDGSTLAINQLTEKDTIQIQIQGEKVKGIAEINMELSYDPSILTIINANSSSLTKSFSIQSTNTKAGTVTLDLKGNKGITQDEGALINLKCTVNSPANTTTMHFGNAQAWDETSIAKNISGLKDAQIKIITGISKTNNELPTSFSLSQNYPNPFNPSTRIRYELPVSSKVKIMIYDILGREITTLINETSQPGRYEIKWNATGYSSGIYFYRIQAGNFVQTKKLLLLK